VDLDQHRLAGERAGGAGVVASARYFALQAHRQIGDQNLDSIDGQISSRAPRSTKNGAGDGAAFRTQAFCYFLPAQMSLLREVA
jgi:hypothetical protein